MTARTIAGSFARLATGSCLTALACIALSTASQATTPTISNLSPSFGNVGASVVIFGSNFGTTTGTVKFNGTTATVGAWSANRINVTVPTGATTGTVTVTNSGGTATSTADFNVLATDATLVLGAFPPLSASCGLLPAGHNCITEYQGDVMPNVDGITLVFQWSSIESSNGTDTGSGGYSWTNMDADINKYVGQTNWNASKKVGIVLSPVTNGNSTSGANISTPSYVFSSTWATTAGASSPLEECTCGYYPGDSGAPTNNGCWNSSTSSDTSGMPAAWQKPFYVALQNFQSAAISHINSASYSYAVAYVRMGLAAGGEMFPYCSSNLETLVSPSTAAELESVWTGYADTMFVYEGGLGSQHPIMAAPDGGQNAVVTGAWADTEASDAVGQGLQLGSEGFQFQDTIHVYTGLPCSNDWCYTFSTDDPPIRELQTLQQSVPAENTCGSNTSAGGDYTDTGSLVCLLPYAEGKANSVELYPGDMFLSYDPNYTGYSTYGAAYASAIAHARAGD